MPAGVREVELSSTHPGGLDGSHCTVSLAWSEAVEVVVGHSLERSLDHERPVTWVVEGEVAALLEIEVAVPYYPTFPSLVVMVESAVVHHSAVTRISAVGSVPAWR